MACNVEKLIVINWVLTIRTQNTRRACFICRGVSVFSVLIYFVTRLVKRDIEQFDFLWRFLCVGISSCVSLIYVFRHTKCWSRIAQVIQSAEHGSSKTRRALWVFECRIVKTLWSRIYLTWKYKLLRALNLWRLQGWVMLGWTHVDKWREVSSMWTSTQQTSAIWRHSRPYLLLVKRSWVFCTRISSTDGIKSVTFQYRLVI